MTRTFLRAAAWLAATLAILAALGWAYVLSLDLGSIPKADPHATAENQPYLKQAVAEKRGRILAVVSSAERAGPLNKKAGYELTELSRAYYAFTVTAMRWTSRRRRAASRRPGSTRTTCRTSITHS